MFREIVSHAGLHGFAIVGLVLFCLAFTAVLLRVALLSRSDAEALNRMPLGDDGIIARPLDRSPESRR